MYKIDNFNREEILSEYIESILSNYSIHDLKTIALSSLHQKKNLLSNEHLENEIMRHYPNILIKNYILENSQRSLQYSSDHHEESMNRKYVLE